MSPAQEDIIITFVVALAAAKIDLGTAGRCLLLSRLLGFGRGSAAAAIYRGRREKAK